MIVFQDMEGPFCIFPAENIKNSTVTSPPNNLKGGLRKNYLINGKSVSSLLTRSVIKGLTPLNLDWHTLCFILG